ncbi:hypothetical protein MG5_04633 [Candida albicans P57072]|uniref:Uncharacterized protein n=1 Tax=Candida albicans P78048 TaxID=1094989 RepID=A0AB34PMN0_CANAX|nr:hypothetical protein MEO_04569 [Candida albicans P94015]KGQ86027.1 hypothetical protein MEU_04634 [Candida albicans P37005]KGQ89569.1 hypothetical protein MG1_04639 [Candida albicans GC75]KGR04897.1 hypothetical protein MG5_04633 [Candida albicans P57072]KGR07373.1 hypothetical protein MG3_04649 [Candida albicans P78048]KGR10999.1 hypothetical protein MG9_04624 [Candida albicans P37037]KGT66020.1 hypothetical protein MEK_04633 [Candida albicans 12C]KGU04743.1 hypothetical protein MEQ_0459
MRNQISLSPCKHHKQSIHLCQSITTIVAIKSISNIIKIHQ